MIHLLSPTFHPENPPFYKPSIGTEEINEVVVNGGAPALTTPLAQGSNAITGQDILGRTYQVQCVTNPQATNWQTLGTATANSSGSFQFIDSNTAPQRFYRTG